MKIADLRQRSHWLLLGFMIVAASVGGALRFFANPAQPSASESSSDTAPASAATAQTFETSADALSKQLQQAATPSELIPSQASADERVADVFTGRLDPFAPVAEPVIRPSSSRSAPKSATAAPPVPAPTTVTAPPPTPAISVSSAPNLPPVPNVAVTPSAVTPPVPLPQIPLAEQPIAIQSAPGYRAPLDPLQAIELSGVVQLGDRVALIVRDARGGTSRHVYAGDSLTGGVRVKSIDMSSQEPLIIFEYQGEEYPRTVGSGGQLKVS